MNNIVAIMCVCAILYLIAKASKGASRIKDFDNQHGIDDPVIKVMAIIDKIAGRYIKK